MTERRLAHRTSATELATGIAYVYSGRGAVALDSLLSAVAQLELRPVVNMLQAAYAATAFAYAQIGNAGQSRKYLDKLRGARGHCNFRTESITDFCADMAGRWLGDTDAVKRLLEQPAATSRRAGTRSRASACWEPQSTVPTTTSGCWRRWPATARASWPKSPA